jgi:hypothetical protein
MLEYATQSVLQRNIIFEQGTTTRPVVINKMVDKRKYISSSDLTSLTLNYYLLDRL